MSIARMYVRVPTRLLTRLEGVAKRAKTSLQTLVTKVLTEKVDGMECYNTKRGNELVKEIDYILMYFGQPPMDKEEVRKLMERRSITPILEVYKEG